MEEEEEEICACELCRQRSRYCLGIENIASKQVEFEIFLCKRCSRQVLLSYFIQTDSEYLKEGN